MEKVRDKDNEKNIWLAFSPIKQNSLNFLIQKGTELGVQKFIPILSDRTIVREVNIERIKKIIVEASEQSNRISIPEINKPESLKIFLSGFPKNGCLIFFFSSFHFDMSHLKLGSLNGLPSGFLNVPSGKW